MKEYPPEKLVKVARLIDPRYDTIEEIFKGICLKITAPVCSIYAALERQHIADAVTKLAPEQKLRFYSTILGCGKLLLTEHDEMEGFYLLDLDDMDVLLHLDIVEGLDALMTVIDPPDFHETSCPVCDDRE